MEKAERSWLADVAGYTMTLAGAAGWAGEGFCTSSRPRASRCTLAVDSVA
jgi:hypothetical protein